MEQPKLTVTIDNEKPIPITDLLELFTGLDREYKSFTKGRLPPKTKASLYLKQVRRGSNIFELVEVFNKVVEHSNQLFDFVEHLGKAITFFAAYRLSKPVIRKLLPKEVPDVELSNLNKITKPIANNQRSQITFSTTYLETHTHFHFDSEQAKKIQDNILKELTVRKSENTFNESISEKVYKINTAQAKDLPGLDTTYTDDKVVFYWYEGNDNKYIEKGFIDKISERALPVDFDNKEVEHQLRFSPDDPFNYGFYVDVEVQTINHQPALYKILRYHRKIEKPT